MKVLYLINYAGRGGTEKYVLKLVEECTKRGVKCCFAYNEPGLLSEQMAQRKISTFQFEMKNPYDINAAKTLARICKQNKIDIIHAQHPRENYIAVLSKLFYPKVKVVFTNHILVHNNAVWKMANRIVAARCDMAIAVCNAGKELLVKNGFSRKKTCVVFNGVDVCDYTDVKTLEQELEIPPDTFTLCALTRFSAEKGVDFLVDVVAELKNMTDRKFVLLLCGIGEDYDKISDKITKLGLDDAIKKLGYRSDTCEILETSDVFVNLSQTEALSFAIIEALSHKKPVVVTNVGGCSDIVNDSTDCGFAVDYLDVVGAASAIKRLMEDRQTYDRMSKNAILNVQRNFDERICFDKTFEIYSTLLKELCPKDNF